MGLGKVGWLWEEEKEDEVRKGWMSVREGKNNVFIWKWVWEERKEWVYERLSVGGKEGIWKNECGRKGRYGYMKEWVSEELEVWVYERISAGGKEGMGIWKVECGRKGSYMKGWVWKERKVYEKMSVGGKETERMSLGMVWVYS